MYFSSFDKSECCACTACEHACPTKSIKFRMDEEGFKYPIINHDTCVNCGLCERICPVSNPNYDNSETPDTYASMIKDIDERKKSSSGGMFFVIAEWTIKKGGIVYGAAFDDMLKLSHIGVESIEDLQKLRGSKYLQSDLKDVFAEIKSHLINGRWCYFVGTGCQVAGLKSFLIKDYLTLLTSDLVCHGVPSHKLFDIHIKYLERKEKGLVSDYQFRDNALWGGCEIFNLATQNGKIKTIKHPSYELSPYLYSFMYAYTYRYSCYDCKFACVPRQGDITIADFWGVKEFFSYLDSTHGVSLILINNKQGNLIWNEVKEQCEFYKSNVEDGAKFNASLTNITPMPPIRESVYKLISKYGYQYVATHEFKSPRYMRIKIYYYVNSSKFFSSFKGIYRIVKSLLKIKFIADDNIKRR